LGKGQESRNKSFTSIIEKKLEPQKTIVRVTPKHFKILQASKSNEVHKHPSTGLSVQQPKGQLALERMITRS
jgi:hypothetical protein